MRKLILIALLGATSLVFAQNLQLHYDFRRPIYSNDPAMQGGPKLTATYEFFRQDKLGNTFLFVDADISSARALDLLYLEISRSFKIGDFPIEPFIEFDGGIIANFSAIPSAFLFGGQHGFGIGNFWITTQLAYKINAFKTTSHDAQLTFVWDGAFCNERFNFSGFADFWTQNKNPFASHDGKTLIILAEPQLWWNVLPKRFSIGTELEIAHSFYGEGSTYVCPTLGVKYQF